ncbi:MAG: GGDEF domain-containing protein [Lachnospiraceae bacterium]|nr:GGDEF domain-containing protein [Lachnospiraceae bacterium]
MNITSYVNNDSQFQLFHGKMSIQFDYSIVNADEKIYKYLGCNSGRPFTTLVHPDDLPAFYECVERLDEGTQYLTLRFFSIDEKYRFLYVIMNKGKDSIDMEIVDIANNHKKFDMLRDGAFKNKKFMNYSDNIYFEYFYDSRTINIFEYVNDRGIVLFNRNIDVLYNEIVNSRSYTKKQKQGFGLLYDSLTEGKDNLSLSLDGSIFGIAKCMLDIKGGIIYKYGKRLLFAAVVNKTEYEQAEESEDRYYKSSHAIDLATGVYNKRAISELAVDILSSLDGKRHYVMMIDIDDFKNVNDTYGHMTGDEVIVKTAELFKRYVGERGYVGRFGGDEFFVITDNIADEESLTYMLKTIRKNLSWDCRDIVPDFEITTSIGVACYPEAGKTYDELLMIADKCLYLAKTKGKNRYIIYRPELHGDIENIKSNKMVALNNFYEDNYQLCSIAMSVMSDIRDPNVSVEWCIDRIRQEFGIDGVAIYQGKDFIRTISAGEYPAPLTDAAFLNDSTKDALFDMNGVLCVNKLLSIKEKWEDIYQKLEAQGNVNLFITKEDSIAVSYDLFSRFRKWSNVERGLLMMIGKALIKKLADISE